MTESGSAGVSPAVAVAVNNLRIDGATAEVLRGFEAEGAEALLLKGASFARWLYDDDEPKRWYSDCDLLVRPGDDEAARDVLARLGFTVILDDREMPDWWQEHAVGWRRDSDQVIVEVHVGLLGVHANRERLWDLLAAEAEPIEVAGHTLRALSIPGRALHLALHAAQHGPALELVTAELERALARVDEGTWRQAARLAEALEATEAFAAGLALVPSGAELAQRLALPTPSDPATLLRAASAAPEALTVEQLVLARGVRARAAIVARKLVPPATFMRAWSPLARRGPLGLAAAYAWRPLWLLKQAWPAFRAWRIARRAGRSPW